MEAGAEPEQRADRAADLDRPSVGAKISAISRSSVVLPEPFRPTTPTDSPGSTVNDTSRTAQMSRARDGGAATTASLSVRRALWYSGTAG